MSRSVVNKPVSRRALLALGGAAVGSVFLAACGQQAAPSPTTGPAAGQKPAGEAPKPTTEAAKAAAPSTSGKAAKTIQWMTPAEVGLERDFYTQFYQQFEKDNPSVKVQVSFEAWNDYFVKLPTVLAGGSIPDMIHQHGSIAQDYGLRGVLRDLFEYMNRDKVSKDQYFPFLLQQMVDYKSKSKLWALPKDSAVYAVYYNKDMFDKAGVPYPKREWTLKDFREMAKLLTVDKNGNNATSPSFDANSIAQWGMNWLEPIPNADPWQPSAWGHAGPWFNEDFTKAYFDSPEHIDFIQQISDMRNKDKTSPAAGATLGQGDPWRNGVTAMTIGHHSQVFFYNAEKKTFKFDVNFSLAGPKGQFQGAACSGWAVPVKAPNPEEGWSLAKYLASEQVQCPIVKAKRWGSAVIQCEDNLLPEDGNPPSFKEVLVDPMKGQGNIKTLAIIYPPFLSDMRQVWKTEFDPVFTNGSVTAADAAKKVQPQIQALLDKAAKM